MKPTKLDPAEFSVTVYAHTPEIGVDLETLLQPDYWTHVASKLRPGYRIEVLAGDGGWWAMLLVRAVGRHEAIVQCLQHVVLGDAQEVTASDMPYEVKWRGPARKFGIVRKADGEVIKDEFPVRELAAKWLNNHMLSMAR